MNGRRTGIVLRLVGIGWYVAICIGGGAYGGFWLDSRLDLTPVLTLVGLVVGIALAVVGMYRMLLAVLASSSDSSSERKS